MGTKKPLEPVIVVSDPRELAFVHVVRALPPASLPDLAEAMRMLVEKRPSQETRAAWMRFFEAAGYPRSEWRERADGIMASGIAAQGREQVTRLVGSDRLAWEEDIRVRLRVLRLHLGLTEPEIAARLGCSVRAYRHHERHCAHRRVGFLLLVSAEFNVSLDWLVTGAKGGLPRNDRRPLSLDMEAIAPVLRAVRQKEA